ncbi:MAG: hypothetical protein IJ368_00965 [Oscillospiraceae bacterium]|nr:hypothetical protein [Oscillospiraceae bacterium]
MISADELLKNASSSAKRNYNFNKRLSKPRDLINGQRVCKISKYKLGIRKVSGNGCGPIAIYNALRIIGQQPDFPTICLAVDKYALRVGGIFGTDPEKLENMFKECRIAAMKAKDYEDFRTVSGVVRASILCYWVGKPKRSLLHFAAIFSNPDGTLSVCNRYSNRTTPSVARNLDRLCPKECYVCGFFLN